MTTPTPPPCDSPKVVIRKSCPKLLPIARSLTGAARNHNASLADLVAADTNLDCSKRVAKIVSQIFDILHPNGEPDE